MRFVEVKGMGGVTYVRITDISAVQIIDQYKCTVVLASGNTIPLVEPAKDVIARVEAALDALDARAAAATAAPAS